MTSTKHEFRAEYVNPFIRSVSNLFRTLFKCNVERKEVVLKRRLPPNLDIVALAGLSGGVRGLVALAFPVRTALAMVSRAYDERIVVVDDKVLDAVAECVNIVAGGAQSELASAAGTPIVLSLPTVIRGNDFSLEYPALRNWVEVPFTSELGPFSIRITIAANRSESDSNASIDCG
ncbi:MAG TPA: chemotaxis protein CheX [bacterium]|nr:chemotaxis protein CheX [bacterium]HQO33120.1 chemotaxis protein CheX [bacterium]HQP97198.1 chemotaxis protein CheX [bacterium]